MMATAKTIIEFPSKKSVKKKNTQNLSRYNIITFLPKFIFQQLSQLSTLYFLVIALLQQIPDISPTGNHTVIIEICIFRTLGVVSGLVLAAKSVQCHLYHCF